MNWNIPIQIRISPFHDFSDGRSHSVPNSIAYNKRHSVKILAMENNKKSTLLFQSEARGHEKGQLRPKSQLATRCSIFFLGENRH